MNETPMTKDSELRLDAQLESLRRQIESTNTPDAVGAKLKAAFAQQHRKRNVRTWVAQWLAPGLGLAASVGMAAWITLAPMAAPHDNGMPGMAEAQPFIALQSLERIAQEPSPQVIETSMPGMMLASMGVPVNPEVAGNNVRAQMLIAANGQPLAVRLSQ